MIVKRCVATVLFFSVPRTITRKVFVAMKTTKTNLSKTEQELVNGMTVLEYVGDFVVAVGIFFVGIVLFCL